MAYLEEWALLERDHSSSLHGAIEALKASTLRLPVVGAIVRVFNYCLWFSLDNQSTHKAWNISALYLKSETIGLFG